MAQDPVREQILNRLRGIQSEMSGTSWAERRDALIGILEHEMRRVPRGRWADVFAGLRRELQEDGASEGTASTKREIEELRAEARKLADERDALRQRVAELETGAGDAARLKEEVQRLRQQAAGGGSGDSGPGAFHDGLRQVAEGRSPKVDGLPLSEPDRRAFRATCALFSFVVDHEITSDMMFHGLAGTRDSRGTNFYQTMRREFRGRFARSLEDSEEGLKSLRQQLDGTLRLVGILGDALVRIVKSGSQKILGEMDPDATLQRHSRAVLGPDYNAAFKSIQEVHRKVSDYLEAEMWEIYFQPAFKRELGKYLEP